MRDFDALPATADCLCGNAAIDGQTAQILEHIRRTRSVAARGDVLRLRRKLLELVSFVLRHALDEEGELDLAGFPGLEEHRRSHDALAAGIARAMAGFARRDDTLRTAAIEIADLIVAHMVEEAVMFKRAFAKR